MVKKINAQFDNGSIVSDNGYGLDPSTAVELQHNQLIIKKNLPLSIHSAVAEIKYNNTTKVTSLKFEIFGINNENRWDQVIIDNYLDLLNANCSFIKKPSFDEKKDIVSFEVQKEQIQGIIGTINKSIETSFQPNNNFIVNRILLEKLYQIPKMQEEIDMISPIIPGYIS
ncbi:MAG: hypothetical protein RCG15_03530 [Candidatus Rickettsia vulgarisii]